MRERHRRRDDRVAAEPRLVRRAVERDQRGVVAGLVEHAAAGQRGGDFAVHRGERALHVQATEGRAAIAQVNGFGAAG